MYEVKKIESGGKSIQAFRIKLLDKNLIVIRGSKGYIMCGYLNLAAAHRAGDAAVKITGVSTIREALKGRVHSCTACARKSGIYPGQPVKEVLKIIA
jgi:uncharacterized protein YunC (DUF1805 family)